jgi:hypothetical protein
LRADGNDDGIVDVRDYAFWRERAVNGSGSGASGLSVPEPSTAGLLMVLGLLNMFANRFRRGHSG